MDTGILQVQVVAAEGAILIEGASVTITSEDGQVLHNLVTDNTGHVPDLVLPAPPAALTEDPYTTQRRYTPYNVKVQAAGYRTSITEGAMVFGEETSILVINLYPLVENEENPPDVQDIDGHALDDPQMPEEQELDVETLLTMAPFPPSIEGRILNDVVIPDFLTVHLGRPNVSAPNVRVPFIDYIKNVTSHEIFDHWPEQAIMANVYCIVSLTLNRVFTEFYRKQGRAFDITNSTTIDQMYVHGGIIGARISAIVDRIFNNYLAQVGHLEPFLALYNDGVVANIPGRLSQWGSFFDARDRGMNAWQIIQH